MREILFRGKFDNGGGQICWIEGDLINYDKDEYLILEQERRFWDIRYDGVSVDKATLGQFTGLTDKSGTKIFEGDIVKTNLGIAYVIWDDTCFAFKSPGSNAIDYEYKRGFKESEVIGNIHDNPELIQ